MIQVRDNRGNYHEALAIYDNAGREIKEVRNNQGRLLFKNWNEIQGSPPITFRGYGKNLTECRIYGNTVQNGTPSSEGPVDVVGCGVWDETQQSYKLPLTVNGTEYPIYLGQVETTRRIKKLVLTGEEDWDLESPNVGYNQYFRIKYFTSGRPSKVICTHYTSPNDNISVTNEVEGVKVQTSAYYSVVLLVRPPEFAVWSLDDFKSYLAQQYAAGTPVTVWYVLAEPETAIVNEPIQKIGDYSDELSIAGVPTINGINTISADTTVQVQPSEMYLKGKIKPVT